MGAAAAEKAPNRPPPSGDAAGAAPSVGAGAAAAAAPKREPPGVLPAAGAVLPSRPPPAAGAAAPNMAPVAAPPNMLGVVPVTRGERKRGVSCWCQGTKVFTLLVLCPATSGNAAASATYPNLVLAQAASSRHLVNAPSAGGVEAVVTVVEGAWGAPPKPKPAGAPKVVAAPVAAGAPKGDGVAADGAPKLVVGMLVEGAPKPCVVDAPKALPPPPKGLEDGGTPKPPGVVCAAGALACPKADAAPKPG